MQRRYYETRDYADQSHWHPFYDVEEVDSELTRLRAELAEAERTIAELRAELNITIDNATEREMQLAHELDEARRVAVWAVRNQVEALGVPPQVDLFVFGRHRTRCDGTPDGIIDALHRVRAAERLVELI